jgi:glycosyltransferase 2 family protein
MHWAMSLGAGVWHSLAGVSPVVLGIAVALHVGKLVAEARAWHWIVRYAHALRPIPFGTTLGAFVSSIGANAVLPARVGEALRVGVVKRRLDGSSTVTIVSTIVLETGIEVLFGAAVIVAVLTTGKSLGASGPLAHGTSAVGASPVALAVAVALACAILVLAVAFRGRAASIAGRMADGFAILRSPRAFVVRVLSWKVVAWTLRLASVYAFLVAFGVPAAPWTAVAVVAAQNLAAAVPLLPGNAGTQQAAIGVALAGTAGAAAVLGFGIGMQAATAVSDLVLGAAALFLVAGSGDLRAACASLLPRRRARPSQIPV